MASLGNRLNKVLGGLLLLTEGATVDPTKDTISVGRGGHSTHGERGRRPGGSSRPLVVQWAERFEHMILAAERDLADAKHGTGRVEFSGTKPAAGLRKRIHEYEGRDPVWIAFIEGCSVELVRKVRREADLNMVTGERLERRERPLTAHPNFTLTTFTPEEP